MRAKNRQTDTLRAAVIAVLVAGGVLAASPAPAALPNLPPGFDTNTLVVLPTLAVPSIDGNPEALWSSARVLEVTAFGASGNFPAGAGIEIRALHNNTTLFLLIEWPDATEDFALDAWQLVNNTTGQGVWARTGWGDDAIQIYFDNGSAPSTGFSTAGCAILCHTAASREMRSGVDNRTLDLWRWASSKSNAFGLMDDLYLDNQSKAFGSPTGGMHGDTPDFFVDNSAAVGNTTLPAYLNSTVAQGQSARYLFDSAKLAINWSTFDARTWPNGATIPGLVLSPPTGGRADIQARATHNGTHWRLEAKRPFVTGDNLSRDLMITDLTPFQYFGVSVTNNKTGENHTAAGPVYKLAFADNVMPDLTIRDVALESPAALIGTPVNLTVAIRNVGFGDTQGPVFVSIVDEESSLEVNNSTVPAISWNDEWLLNVSFASSGYGAGAHNFTAAADTAGSEAESSESNNTYRFQVVFVTTLQPPDLVVDSVLGPTGPVYAGEPFWINGTVRNIGSGDSVFNVSLRTSYPTLGNQTTDLGPIRAGQAANFTFLWDSTNMTTQNYNFEVAVDPDDQIAEAAPSGESNNIMPVSIGVEARPDLVATSLTASPTAVRNNETLTLELVLRNAGAAVSANITVWYYLDDSTSTSTVNRTAGANFTVSLAHGAAAFYAADWAVPESLPLGSHLLRAWADAEGVLGEILETNNNASVLITVLRPPLPDLSVTAATLSAGSYRVGDTASLTVNITNLGEPYTGDLTLRVVDATTNTTVANRTVPPIAKNQNVTVAITFVVVPGALGRHTIQAIIDPQDVLAEDNEFNNAFSTSYTRLQVAQPDLTITSLTFSPATPARGDLVALTVVVQNIGNAGSNASNVQFKFGAAVIGTVALPSLAPGQTHAVSITWNSSAVAALSALIAAEVDTNGTTAESDESNNRIQVTVPFQRPGTAVLSLVSVSVSPATAQEGTHVTFSAQVLNNGTIAGSGQIAFKVDGEVISAENFTIGPGESRTFQVNWTTAGAGNHTVRAELILSGIVVDQKPAQVTVTVQGARPGSSAALIAGVAVLLAAAAASLLIWSSRRKPGGEDSPPKPDDKEKGEEKKGKAS